MSNSPNEEARRMGISDEDLGLSTPDYGYHLPDEKTVADVAKKEPDAVQKNAEPIPPGTPDDIATCFRAIPVEQVRAYRELYDGFVNKDMPFPEFCVELAYINSPMMMKRDLDTVAEQRAMGYARKQKMDVAMKAHRN